VSLAPFGPFILFYCLLLFIAFILTLRDEAAQRRLP